MLMRKKQSNVQVLVLVHWALLTENGIERRRWQMAPSVAAPAS